VCSPSCGPDDACQDDGCGGRCDCPPDYLPNGDDVFVPAEQCTDTCESAGAQCGEVCGEQCGSACADGLSCESGECVCEPSCDGTRCEDGCGGYCPCAEGTVCDATQACVSPADCHDTCEQLDLSCGSICGVDCGQCADDESCVEGACQGAINCSDCALTLSLVRRQVVDERLRSVTLAVEYAPSELEPRPRLADLRIRAPEGAVLATATAGPALQEAGKELFVDGDSGEPWKLRSDGTLQFLAYKASNVERLASGRVLTLTFTLDAYGPVEFSLVRRQQVFAPPAADAALQSTSYETAVVVTR
jgi:hypothetical protein